MKKERLVVGLWLLVICFGFVVVSAGEASKEKRFIVGVLDGERLDDDLKSKIVDELNELKEFDKKLVLEGVDEGDLESSDVVVSVEEDYVVRSLGEWTPWNYEVIGINFSLLESDYGGGVRIAVLDTGVDYNLIQVRQGYDFVNEDGDVFDDNGHGTFVVQILRSLNRGLPLVGAEIYAVKVLDERGVGYVSDVIEGINWAVDNEMDIVLMSFGGNGNSLFLEEVINQAYREGVLFVSAVGNEGQEFIMYPAGYEPVIAAGSINKELDRSVFSNFGNGLECVAPGEEILASNGRNWFVVQGTSFSVPHVGIVVADILSRNEMSNLEVREIMRESALDLGEKGWDEEFGWGLVRVSLGEDENFSMGIFPRAGILFPLNNSAVNSRDVLVEFEVVEWNVGGKGDRHVHFHLQGLEERGLGFSDHLMFYSGDDRTVEKNFISGETEFASWIDEGSLRLNDLPNGWYRLRVHLANEDHSLPDGEGVFDEVVFEVSADNNNLCSVVSPVNEGIYDNRRIPIEIEAEDFMDLIEYKDESDRKPRLRRLCSNCDGYDRMGSFRDGGHEVIVRCVDGEESETHRVEFFVDSREPRIFRTEPRRGFVNGSFSVEFREDNPIVMRYFYGKLLDIREGEVDIERNCFEMSRGFECGVGVDLSDFDGQEIEYWFEVEDVVGRVDESRRREVRVDVSGPVIEEFNWSVDRSGVRFLVSITEENFDRVEYIDRNERWPRWRRLCSRLRDGKCEVRKSFRRGEHDVGVRVVDEAGNLVYVGEEIVFAIL